MIMKNKDIFDISCTRCSRLSRFLKQVKKDYKNYYALPVPPFGDQRARLLIVGLAPGMHGANATGRPFTGDFAGILLYDTLYKFGFSNQPISESLTDGLKLTNCRITNAVKCLPPQNKPVGTEISNCNDYLKHELENLPEKSVIIALGLIAHQAVLTALQLKKKDYPFKHEQEYRIAPGLVLIDSYHCSRYNTQTKRLTEKMFHQVFAKAKRFL